MHRTPVTTLSERQAADRLCDLACALERKGALNEAKDAYQQAIAAQSAHYRSHFLLSLLHARMGESHEARAAALRAHKIAPCPASHENYLKILSESAFHAAEALDGDDLFDVWCELIRNGAKEPA